MKKSESKYFKTATKMDLALISLLKTKPFEYITVSEVCKEAGVNRSTFYLHYENICDLLDETSQYLIDDFWSFFTRNEVTLDIKAISDCSLEQLVFIGDKYLVPYFTYIKENKEVFKVVLSHNEILGLEKVYKYLYKKIFNPTLDRFGYPEKNRHYVMMYYMSGINAIVYQWLLDDCRKPIEELVEIITNCVYGIKGVQEKLDL